MPIYMYRREDGTTFDYRQKFSDDALQVDPETGQRVTRVMQPAGVIFKGSGFYINDSKNASKTSITSTPKTTNHENHEGGSDKPAASAESSKESKETKDAPKETPKETKTSTVTASAD